MGSPGGVNVKNIFTSGTRVAQDGAMTFNRPVWTTRDTQRMWNSSCDLSREFAVADLEEQADEWGMPALCWRCIDVSTMHVVRHDV